MKNQEKDIIIYGKELRKLVKHTLGEIKEMVESSDLVWNNPGAIKEYYDYDYGCEINKATKRTIKRLNRQLWYWNQNPNRQSANRLFHFIKTVIGDKNWESGYFKDRDYTPGKWNYELSKLKVLPSHKEQEIQRKRKVWKELRDQADLALKDYKEEKGDFYKKRIIENSQLIAA